MTTDADPAEPVYSAKNPAARGARAFRPQK